MKQASSYLDRPWLKHYDEGVPSTLIYEEICIPDFLARSVRDFPENTALIFQGYKMNFRQLQEAVDRFATCLTDFGIKKGDPVAIMLPTTIPCVVAYYAIIKIGAITVMNNPLYSDVELEHQFNDSGAILLITLDLMCERMINLRAKTSIKKIIYTSIADYLDMPREALIQLGVAAEVKDTPDVFKWQDCLAKYLPNPPEVKLSFDDAAMYQYTGGTTGVSKGVVLTHGNLSKQVQQLLAWFPTLQRGQEIMLGAPPYFHVYGVTSAMNMSIAYAWTQVLVPRPQTEPLMEAIKTYKPTFAPLVPAMFIGILNHPSLKSTDLSCIKVAFSGSAPLAVETINEFEKISGAVIIEGFGMTETSPDTHANPYPGLRKRKVGSIGLPIPDTQCRIVSLDDEVTDVPFGERGELVVKGPQVMREYKGKPEETANILRDGWLYTGDIATMDEDGFFYIVDRKKDMIISGGFNVYPRDIDEVYYGHPKVLECCSIGIPDPKQGEVIKLFIVLKDGETATAQEMIEYGKTKLTAYKLPKVVEFRTDMPKTAIGKILRKELRAEEMSKREINKGL